MQHVCIALLNEYYQHFLCFHEIVDIGYKCEDISYCKNDFVQHFGKYIALRGTDVAG